MLTLNDQIRCENKKFRKGRLTSTLGPMAAEQQHDIVRGPPRPPRSTPPNVSSFHIRRLFLTSCH